MEGIVSGLQLGQLAGHLDPGSATSGHHDGEAAGVRIGSARDDLQAAEDGVAHLQRLGAGVHRHRVLGCAGDAEVIGGDPVADHQVVEVDPYPVVADHLLGIVIDSDDGGAPEAYAVVLGREVAQRVGDVTGVQAAGGDLIEQGLEGVVRVPVDKGHPEPFLGELGRRRHTSEATPDDNHMRHLSHGHI